MTDFATTIEALEHRWMRAWISREGKDMKALASRDLVVLFGTGKPVLLDRPSWLQAAETRLRCTTYRFGPVYVRRHGKTAIFTAPVDFDLSVDRVPMMDRALMSSVWVKTAVRRRWVNVERIVAGLEDAETLHAAVRSMQLWR